MEFSKSAAPEGCAACGHDHLVEFYETEESLIATVADYLVPALRGYEAAVVVATAEHRGAMAEAIRGAGIDLDEAMRDGRYQAVDAANLLSRFMRGAGPDPARFRAAVEGILDAAGDRHVRVYGEMVALLWTAGDVMSTIALEDLWNEIVSERGFSLFCGYPISGFDVQSRSVFEHICGQHSSVRRV
jgi:hypothetical protein